MNARTTVLREFRPALVAAVGFGVFANLALLAPTLYTIQVFDRVLTSRSVPTLAMLTVGVVLALLAMSAVDVARSRLLVASGRRLEQRLGEPTLAALLGAGGGAGARASGQALRDIGAVRAFVAGPGFVALMDAPWMLVYGGVIGLFHPALAGVALTGAALIVALTVTVERVQRRHLEAQAAAHQRAGGWLAEALRHAATLRSLGMARTGAQHWAALNDEALARAQAAAGRSGTALALSRFARQAIQVAMLATGAWLVLGNAVSPGVMIAATILFGRAVAPLEALVGHWQALVAAGAAWSRLGALPAPDARAERTPLPQPAGRLVLQRVALAGHSAETPVLRHVEFDLAAGRALGVVGPSGAGKSSLLRLIAGAWVPSAGTVTLDGAELRQWDPDALGRHLGYLPQEPALLPGTVARNIARFGDAGAEAVIDAARRAGIHDMVLALPQGLDTIVGEGGWALSAGQARRVALARALLGSPRLLVLDEPDAHLDAEGEQALLRVLAELKAAGTTVVVATHKLAVLAALDDLLVLREGRMEMMGPREAVLARLAPPAAAGVKRVA